MKYLLLIIFLPIIILASVRGAVVYHIGTPANLTYGVSAFLLCGIGLLSTLHVFRVRECSDLSLVQKTIQLNVVLQGAFFMVYIVLGDISTSISQVYIFIIFPVIIILARYSTIKSLENLLHVIFIITAEGVMRFYLIGKYNMQELRFIREILRPAGAGVSTLQNLQADGSVEYLAQGFGYQANHHDASNIVVMISMYYLIKMLIVKPFSKALYFILFIVGLATTLLTASATNSAILLGMVFILIIYLQKGFSNRIIAVVLGGFLFLLINYIDQSYFTVLHVTSKFVNQSNLVAGGMLNSLNFTSMLASLHCLLIGFGNFFNVPMMNSEIAFLKIIVSYGIFPALVFYSIIFMPMILLRRCRAKKYLKKTINRNNLHQLSLFALPVITGTMTLLHYGSLLRITSIGVFCVLFSIFIKYYIMFMRHCQKSDYKRTPVQSAR